MSSQAVKNGGEIIDVNSFDEDSWNYLKKNYSIGDFKMICCGSNAIPKTSINFTKFFAHQNDFCETNPETIWHKSIKKKIIESLIELGYQAEEERQGDGWIADVYLELKDRKIVFEIQHSPQTLPVYFERTNKYKSNDIEVFWILYKPVFKTFTKAVKNKMMKELNSKFNSREIREELKKGGFPSLKDLPVFGISDDNFRIKNAYYFDYSIVEFIESIFQNKLIFDRTWRIID